MGFNFSHPQKSGGAMAPLAPPSEGALTYTKLSQSFFDVVPNLGKQVDIFDYITNRAIVLDSNVTMYM